MNTDIRANFTATQSGADKSALAIARLVTWALAGADRVFEIRFISEAPHPWAVECSDDALSWSAVADCHSELEHAVDHALRLAAEERAK